MSNFRITATTVNGLPTGPSAEHDLKIAYDSLDALGPSAPRTEQLSNFVYKTSSRAPFAQVVPLWDRSVKKPRTNPCFALAVARAAPVMITRAEAPDVGKIYELLGDTLASVPAPDKGKAADALMHAVLRTPGEVPSQARSVIREYRQILQQYPLVWRNIGSYGSFGG